VDKSFEYVFPAIRGIQAGREFYVSMCLAVNSEDLLVRRRRIVPELRAQRILNKARVPDIAHYILENRENYVFPLSQHQWMVILRFEAIGSKEETSRVGALHVDMRGRFIINDGQHRRAAIELAIREEPTLRRRNNRSRVLC